MPDALPAVTVGVVELGVDGLELGERSRRSRRDAGARRRVNSRAMPSRSRYSTGTISSSNAPESIDAMAWPWLYAAHSSTSRRVRPISRAVFSPTVIDMSNAGASGVSGWLGDIHICGSPPGSSTIHDCGDGARGSRCRRRRRRCPCRPGCCRPRAAPRSSPDAQWRLSAMPGDVRSRPRTHRGVAGDVTPAVERLAEDDVVDVGGVDARALHGLADRDLGQAERVDVDERSLAGPADGRAGGGNDDGFGHGGSSSARVTGHCNAGARSDTGDAGRLLLGQTGELGVDVGPGLHVQAGDDAGRASAGTTSSGRPAAPWSPGPAPCARRWRRPGSRWPARGRTA